MQLYSEFVVGQYYFSELFGLGNSAVVENFAVTTQSEFVVETCNTRKGFMVNKSNSYVINESFLLKNKHKDH